MVRIVGCAYRGWGIDLMERVALIDNVKTNIINTHDNLENQIDGHNPDIVLFIGWSWKVPQEIINKYLCLCVHPSPLPKYRGGSPIQHQIINGDLDSALSIFKMTNEVDAGPLCFQGKLSLRGPLNGILSNMTNIGAKAMKQIIEDYKNGCLKFWPQQGEATYYKRRTPEQSRITPDEFKNAEYLYNKIRALQNPYPTAFIECYDGSILYITGAQCG